MWGLGARGAIKNMKDIVSFVLTISLLIGTLVYSGWFFGRRYEQQFWTKTYKEEMNKLCLECAGLR